MSAAKQKGTLAESAFVKYLSANGFPHAERRALAGVNDQGDIAGVVGMAFEVKNHKKYSFPAWLKEATIEKENSRADYCPLIVKPVGVGTNSVGDWWAILTVAELVHLIRTAGYGDAL